MPETHPVCRTASSPALFSRTPFRALREELDHLINRVSHEWDGQWLTADFRPAVDLSETAESLEVRMDMPGVKPDDVTIELSDNKLQITGERKEEKEQKGRTYHRTERSTGQFFQMLTLPCSVKQEKVQAEFHDGVLTVVLPKCEAAKTHKVKINANGSGGARK